MRLFYQEQYGALFRQQVCQLDYLPHIHNAVELAVLEQGSVTAFCAGEQVELHSGDIFIAFPNQIHSYEDSKNLRSYLLILPVKPYLTPYASFFSAQKPKSACIRAGTWEHTGLPMLLEMACNDATTAAQRVMFGYAQVIFGKLLPLLSMVENTGSTDTLLHNLMAYVTAHYRQPLTRGEIARELGYTESYISHVCSMMLRLTLPEYINALRIHDASAMLLETDLPVTQIASELGFGSVRNFNRVFQKEMGTSPSVYRRLVGK